MSESNMMYANVINHEHPSLRSAIPMLHAVISTTFSSTLCQL